MDILIRLLISDFLGLELLASDWLYVTFKERNCCIEDQRRTSWTSREKSSANSIPWTDSVGWHVVLVSNSPCVIKPLQFLFHINKKAKRETLAGRENGWGNVWCSAPVTQGGLERRNSFPLPLCVFHDALRSLSESERDREGNNVWCDVCQLINMAEAEVIGGRGNTPLFVSSLLLEMSSPVFVYFDWAAL